MTQSSIQALIALLDDPDQSIFEHVRQQLLDIGLPAVKELESSWEEKDYGPEFLSRVELLIHDIQFDATKKDLTAWFDSADRDLFTASLIVARYQFPGLNEAFIRDFIDKVRKDCWLELNPHMTAYENVRVLNRIFFDKYHFKGNSDNYTSVHNSYLNTVVESRKGNPLSLSIIYSIVAQQLGLPVYGVNLPNHFILAYMDEHGTSKYISNANGHGVLFYINAFSKGTLFQEDEISQFLKGLNLPDSPSFYEPCSNSEIIRRMITNLVAGYQQMGKMDKVEELLELRALLD